MPQRRLAQSASLVVPEESPANASGRVAVVDIGSNTLRLVVYDVPTRLPVPMFNEKAQCALARGLAKSGKLNPEGKADALRSISRFVQLSRAMEVERLELVATAAVRDALDGPAFVAEIERRFKVKVSVPSGAEEARLAALGMLSGVPDADGLLGDLGGGSLDLVVLDKGRMTKTATFKLGHLVLPEMASNDIAAADKLVARELRKVPWIGAMKGRSLYAVGGSWRTVARLFIEQTRYPLHVIDGFSIAPLEALRQADHIASMSRRSLAWLPTVSPRRAETLPFAAAALGRLIRVAKPKRVVFSGFGMREGRMLECLPPKLRDQDPLISGAATLAERTGRFSISGQEISNWMAPLFKVETAAERRLRLAASLLSDIGWTEHPDYRGEHAFHRVLRLSFAGLTHADRVYLALAVFIRYNGSVDSPIVQPVLRLLDKRQMHRVEILGLALRLAHTISGSAPGLLQRTHLKLTRARLILEVPRERDAFVGETVERRLKTLGRVMGLDGKIA